MAGHPVIIGSRSRNRARATAQEVGHGICGLANRDANLVIVAVPYQGHGELLAVFIDKVLIPVRYLVNGRTIVQTPVSEVTYYHLELSTHDVILAENLAVESYLDTGSRRHFANGSASVALHPDFSSLAWEAGGCATLVVTGPRLDAVRHGLGAIARLGRRSA